MDAVAAPQACLRDVLPWAKLILDYTDAVAAAVPEELLDWRPVDPSGKWSFSLAEIMMHIADTRRMFAGELGGVEDEEAYWSQGPGEDGVWLFKPYAGKPAILGSLATARQMIEVYLDLPGGALTDVTEGSRRLFAKRLEQLKAEGKDTLGMELRGPANIVRVLMAVAAHESGHRGSLLTLLRSHGINPGGE